MSFPSRLLRSNELLNLPPCAVDLVRVLVEERGREGREEVKGTKITSNSCLLSLRRYGDEEEGVRGVRRGEGTEKE